jgi:sensor histidine kinase regulating citrate/malate metabolism
MEVMIWIGCIYNTGLALMFFLLHSGILHKKGKVSFLSHIIFYTSIFVITYCELQYFKGAIWIDIILTTMVFFLSVNSQYLMRKSYEDRMKEYQYKVVGQQVDEVQNIYLTMRGWRHDYHNHMQTLKAHLAMRRYDLIGDYLNQLEMDLSSIDLLIKSGNINLDAILNSKLSFATAKQIDINCKAGVPEQLKVSDIDLCVLIGNLLDNALEACDGMREDKAKFLRVYIGIFKQQLYISVTNSTDELVRKINPEFITTKKGNHGHGLKRIDNIVNKYGGFINRKNEPGVFVTEIMLPL